MGGSECESALQGKSYPYTDMNALAKPIGVAGPGFGFVSRQTLSGLQCQGVFYGSGGYNYMYRGRHTIVSPVDDALQVQMLQGQRDLPQIKTTLGREE